MKYLFVLTLCISPLFLFSQDISHIEGKLVVGGTTSQASLINVNGNTPSMLRLQGTGSSGAYQQFYSNNSYWGLIGDEDGDGSDLYFDIKSRSGAAGIAMSTGTTNNALKIENNGQVSISNLPLGGNSDSFVTADAAGNLRKVNSPCKEGTEITSLPYTINSPGYYYIAQNLSGSQGISILADNVTLDLRGHEIKGTSPTTDGIRGPISPNPMVKNTTIQDGHVVGWKTGIYVRSTNSLICNMSVTDNEFSGILVVDDTKVLNCHAEKNGYDGFAAIGADNHFENCTSIENTEHGFSAVGSTLMNCQAISNDLNGFNIYDSKASNCKASWNDNHGFLFENGSFLKDNYSTNNEMNGFYEDEGFPSALIGNIASDNGDYGFTFANNFGNFSFWRGNMSFENSDGAVQSPPPSDHSIDNMTD